MNYEPILVALIILSGFLVCIWLLDRIRGRVEAIWTKLEGWENELQRWAGGVDDEARPKFTAENSHRPSVDNDAGFHRD